MDCKKKRLIMLTLICCILFVGIFIFYNNTSPKKEVDLTSITISHILSQTDSFVNEWSSPDYGKLTPQSIRMSSSSILITYDNDFPNKYIILDVIINKESSMALIKHISYNPKQNFNNIYPIKYDLDYFLPKISKWGIDMTSFYISNESIYFSYEDGMPAGVCNTQSGEVKLFDENKQLHN